MTNLTLQEINQGEERSLITGTVKDIKQYLLDNYSLIDWVLEEDPDFDLPEIELVENERELKYELDKMNLTEYELILIGEDGYPIKG